MPIRPVRRAGPHCACCSERAMPRRRPRAVSVSRDARTAERSRASRTDRSSTSWIWKSISTASCRARCRRAGRSRRWKRNRSAPAPTCSRAAIRAANTISFRPNSTRSTMASRARRRRRSTAVDSTAGQVLHYGANFAQVAYSSCCGGHTEASSDAWGGAPFPYLEGVVMHVLHGVAELSLDDDARIRRDLERAFRRRWRRSAICRTCESRIATPAGAPARSSSSRERGSTTVAGSRVSPRRRCARASEPVDYENRSRRGRARRRGKRRRPRTRRGAVPVGSARNGARQSKRGRHRRVLLSGSDARRTQIAKPLGALRLRLRASGGADRAATRRAARRQPIDGARAARDATPLLQGLAAVVASRRRAGAQRDARDSRAALRTARARWRPGGAAAPPSGRPNAATTRTRQRWVALARPARRLHSGDRIAFGELGEAIVRRELAEGLREIELAISVAVRRVPGARRTDAAAAVHPQRLSGSAGTLSNGLRARPRKHRRADGVAALHAGAAGRGRAPRRRDRPDLADVGLGTFRPVTAETIDEHVMHAEPYAIGDGAAADLERARTRRAPHRRRRHDGRPRSRGQRRTPSAASSRASTQPTCSSRRGFTFAWSTR